MNYRALVLFSCVSLSALVFSCAKAVETPAAAPTSSASVATAVASSSAPVAAEEPSKTLPTSCADSSSKVCTPDPAFVRRLCNGAYPDVALVMFAKDSPWTRAYLNRKVKGWNASGGNSSIAEIPADEEVLVLFERKANTGGMIVSGASGGFDVLRWDGSCVSLGGEELSMRRPAKAKHAPIPWRKLEEKTREALLGEQALLDVYKRHRKECKGVSVGEVSTGCVKAESDLSASVVNAIWQGLVVPVPSSIP